MFPTQHHFLWKKQWHFINQTGTGICEIYLDPAQAEGHYADFNQIYFEQRRHINAGRLLTGPCWRVCAAHGRNEITTRRRLWSGVVRTHQVPILTWLEVPDNPLFIHLHLIPVGPHLFLSQFFPAVYLVVICTSPKLPNPSAYKDKWLCFGPQWSKTVTRQM